MCAAGSAPCMASIRAAPRHGLRNRSAYSTHKLTYAHRFGGHPPVRFALSTECRFHARRGLWLVVMTVRRGQRCSSCAAARSARFRRTLPMVRDRSHGALCAQDARSPTVGSPGARRQLGSTDTTQFPSREAGFACESASACGQRPLAHALHERIPLDGIADPLYRQK